MVRNSGVIWYVSNPHLVSHYTQYEHDLHMTDISYSIPMNKIAHFEYLNVKVSVKVFGYEYEVYPLHIREHRGRACHINLLLLSHANSTTNYCLIHNLSQSLFFLTKSTHQTLYCIYCMHWFNDNNDTHAARQTQKSQNALFAVRRTKGKTAHGKRQVDVF